MQKSIIFLFLVLFFLLSTFIFFHPAKNEAEIDQKILTQFKNLDDVHKYAWINEIGASEGPEVAWNYVVAAYTTPEGVVGNAHDMAHLVGQLLFKKYGFKGLSTCTPIFAFGCYHGLMQVAFDKNKPEEFQNKLVEAEKGCSAVGPTSSPSYWSCIHGIGHGVATFRDYKIDKSLADCSTLDKSISTYCYDGVFMEFSNSAAPEFYKQSDPLYPCDTVDEAYKSACARAQVQVMKLRFGMSAPAIADACLAGGNQTVAYHCVDAVGYSIAQGSQGDSRQVLSGCNAIKEAAAAAQCLAAAAGELVFQDTLGWQQSATAICVSLAGSYKASCDERVESVKKSYGRN